MDCELGIKTWLKHVLVHSGCYNKIPQTGWLKNNRNTFSQFWGLEVCDQRASMVGWGPTSRCRLLIVSSHGGRGKGTLKGLLYKGTNYIHEYSSSWPNHLPEAHLLMLSPWGLGFNIRILGGHTQAIASIISALKCSWPCVACPPKSYTQPPSPLLPPNIGAEKPDTHFSSFPCSLEWPCNPDLGCEP